MINEINLETKEIRIDGAIYKLGERFKLFSSEYISILCPVCGEKVGSFYYDDGDIIEPDYNDGCVPAFSYINRRDRWDQEPICPHLPYLEEEGRKWMERKEKEKQEATAADAPEEESKPVNNDMLALLMGAGFKLEDE